MRTLGYLALALLLLASPAWAQQAKKKKMKEIVVCIDPGHGGKDPGKLAGSAQHKNEKHIALAIALKLGAYLSERIEGLSVIYTRTDDSSVSLEERVELANKKKADYFISIHCNAHPSSKVSGTQTHIHSHDFKASRALALRIEKEFSTRGGRHSQGIRSARDRGQNLYVVQYTDMPSVLIEAGYLTNPQEEKYLNSEWGQDLIASAIFRAFRAFLEKEYPAEDRNIVYKVQIAASSNPVAVNTKAFDELGLLVVEHEGEGTFKYKYMVGHEYDMDGANKLLKEVKKAGFQDAFIVQMVQRDAKVYRKLNKASE
jgi:N-acetylmuramoyl-L-alanine amidase